MFRIFLVFMVGLVSMGQADEIVARAHPRPPKHYRLNPANVPESSLAAAKTVVRDHRFGMEVTYNIYTATMKPTAAAGSEASLLIRYANGAEYDGRDAYGTIRSAGLGLCLTNPATYVGGADSGVLRWETCQPSSAGLPFRRQLFLIAKNSSRRSEWCRSYPLQIPTH